MGAEVAAALERARSRLAGQIARPDSHAAHAMKVLVKFKLLEWQAVDFGDLLAWAKAMPYMERVRTRFSPDVPLADWLGQLTAELEKAGAARREGRMLHNT